MAQPLIPATPAFILACFGTDNSFSTEEVLKRWCYIREECNKRGIRVISHGADGDTRALLGMKISTNFLVKDKSFTDSVRECPIKIPSKWHTWFLLNHPTSICYVQDMVHVGVKLKSRLLKPSIIIPLDKYTAGAHHLHLLFQMYNKDQHGLHQKDWDHKDRQNYIYDAVVRIVSQSTIQLLKLSFFSSTGNITLQNLQHIKLKTTSSPIMPMFPQN